MPGGDTPKFRNLREHIGKKMPKKGRGKSSQVDPYPDLSKGQKRVIELDYGMKNGMLKIRVRKAFLYYLLKRLGLDAAPETRDLKDLHIALLNREELNEANTTVSEDR